MADSQLMCMEDGHIGPKVPESRPEFYYSEEQRAAVEQLLLKGDGAFKMRLKDDNMKDFLSAREVKLLVSTFKRYDPDGEDGGGRARSPGSEEEEEEEKEKGKAAEGDADSGIPSTYWPQMSDTEVPPLDIGWPSGSVFKGVTRVAVHTHPPKDNGPHIKEVVRKLIQEAAKVIAIVMDLLTDVHILQDLMDASWRRSVPVYILLDEQGMPHFLDMCSRLEIGAKHLRNMRARTLQGVGFGLCAGRLPGAVCHKYMLIDGDKVMFGSYSFSWCTSRMDRNMVTVMTGQVVDFFDQDFRELYAVSQKLNLYKEFHVSPPAAQKMDAARSRTASKRPPLPATTSRFQVTLGDSKNVDIQVPAHKFYNPKYALAFGEALRPTGSLQEPGPTRIAAITDLLEVEKQGQRFANSEKVDRLTPLPAEAPSDIVRTPNGFRTDKKERFSFRQIFRNRSRKLSRSNSGTPTPETSQTDENQDRIGDRPPKANKKQSIRKATSELTVSPEQDKEGGKSQRKDKQACKVS
ncbi:protein FAM83F-like [Salarias fasciatus]|uniref:Protein FAM83F-like n=1 Tax=Salarias fasciatus TaxID=181472 RepID=A0A672GK32_SALFA|nr:protein FAM83F-like [Salarias fasciatus]